MATSDLGEELCYRARFVGRRVKKTIKRSTHKMPYSVLLAYYVPCRPLLSSPASSLGAICAKWFYLSCLPKSNIILLRLSHVNIIACGFNFIEDKCRESPSRVAASWPVGFACGLTMSMKRLNRMVKLNVASIICLSQYRAEAAECEPRQQTIDAEGFSAFSCIERNHVESISRASRKN